MKPILASLVCVPWLPLAPVLDSYTYDIAYIDHLIEKINSGTYDVDLLSASEQEQVAQRLQTKTNNT